MIYYITALKCMQQLTMPPDKGFIDFLNIFFIIKTVLIYIFVFYCEPNSYKEI